MNKILIGLVLIIFSLCDGTRPTSASDNQETKKCEPFKIDTVSILTNENLDKLISKAERADLKRFSEFESAPGFIKTFLDSIVGEKFSIADPGEDWQATDVALEDLPDRQLVYLGVGQEITVLAFNKGGSGMSERILIFNSDNSCIKDFWCGGVMAELTDKNQILNHLKENIHKQWGLNTNIIYF